MSRPTAVVERPRLLPWYNRNRERAAQLFGLIADEAYYSRPIALRNPIVFYQGHIPAFSFNTLVKQGLGRPSIDARLEQLFARGIDPHEGSSNVRARGNEADQWPSRDEVDAFCAEADRQVRAALAEQDQVGAAALPPERVEAAHCILEHEATHLETLMYMWHQLPLEQKRRPAGYRPLIEGAPPAQAWVDIPPGLATLGIEPGVEPFAWDNEMPGCVAQVPAFRIQQHNVSNADYLTFVEAGGYADARWWRAADWAWINAEGIGHPLFWQRDGERWRWRGMFDLLALPAAWPVWVSQAEASAYCRWRGLSLPSEAQYQRAAYGAPDGQPRRYPWGNAPADATRGVFDFQAWDPQPVGSHPAGRSAWGVDDLLGNGWEWTATAFAPFPGFEVLGAYPEYSAEFFDGEHFVMKGAAPVTVRELFRPSLRNWFRARYRYMYASFRCVAGARQ